MTKLTFAERKQRFADEKGNWKPEYRETILKGLDLRKLADLEIAEARLAADDDFAEILATEKALPPEAKAEDAAERAFEHEAPSPSGRWLKLSLPTNDGKQMPVWDWAGFRICQNTPDGWWDVTRLEGQREVYVGSTPNRKTAEKLAYTAAATKKSL